MVATPLKRPLLTVFAGLIVAFVSIFLIFKISRPTAILATVLFLLFLTGCLMMYSLEANSSLIHRCLQIDKNKAFLYMALSSLFLPLYPFLAFPMMLASGILLMMGRCQP